MPTITSFKQLEVAILLYDKGPLSARELHATGTLLAFMERRGVVEASPGGSGRCANWALTSMGRNETRRCRKAYRDWLRMR